MKRFFILCTLFILASAHAAEPPAQQDPAALVRLAQDYLNGQASHLPGKVTVQVHALDQRIHATACTDPQAFLPGNSRLWGHTLVGVRCNAPQRWTLYLQADIIIHGNYLVSTSALTRGQTVESSQFTVVSGDLTRLPSDLVTDISQAEGKALTISLPAGTPLRTSALRAQTTIQPGQPVKVISHGNGFDISAEAQAITPAEAGQRVEVRVAGGGVVTGIAGNGNTVLVNW